MNKNSNIGINELSKYDTLLKEYINQKINEKISFVLNKTLVKVPQVYKEHIFDGSTQTAPINGIYDTTYYSITGSINESQAGTYTTTFSLLDSTTTMWDDLTTADKTITWVINRKKLSIPTISLSDNVYNGSAKTPIVEINNDDMNLITTTGDTTGTNAGNYNITFSLVDTINTEWEDEVITDKIITWTIQKSNQQNLVDTVYKSFENNYPDYKITFNSSTKTITLPWASVTEPTITLFDNTVITATKTTSNTYNGEETNYETVTIYSFKVDSVNDTMGGGIITISCPGDTNHLGAEKQFIISCFIPNWSTGTDAEIVSALTAHYNGDIDLKDLWEVGQERIITLNAIAANDTTGMEAQSSQQVTLVLMNKGGKTLTTPVNGITECAFVVGQKDSLATKGKIHTTNDGTISWKDSVRRVWLNSEYKNAIPSNIVSIFKQHKNLSYDKSISDFANTDDYFSLPAEKEIRGNNNYADPNEPSTITQFKYYINTENRTKEGGQYWTRSAKASSSSYPGVTSEDYWSFDNSYGIAPFGVI